jgi:hypothetical protein
LAPPSANLPPVDALTPTSPWALPCASLNLPESLVDQGEPHDRRSPSFRGRRRTAIVELASLRILRVQGPAYIFPRPHGSFRCNTLLSTARFFTAVRAPAAAPPLRCRSPATSPADPPPPIDRGWAQLQFPAACLPPRAPPHRRRARHRRRVQGDQGHICEIFKTSRVLRTKRFFPFAMCWMKLVKSI